MRCSFAMVTALILVCSAGKASAQLVSDPVAIEAGLAAVREIKPLALGEKQEYFFVIAMGPKQKMGYATITLEAITRDGETVYRYHNQSAVLSPTKARVVADTVALLRTTFEPIEVDTWRAMISANGEVRSMAARAVVGRDKVALSAEPGGETDIAEAVRPEEPFVVGIEIIIERVDWKKHTSFLIREFDVHSGGARDLNVSVETWTDGLPTVVTRTASGAVSYQFWLDSAGRISRWGEASMPVLFERATREEIDALIPRIGRVERPKKSAKKPTGDAAIALPASGRESSSGQD